MKIQKEYTLVQGLLAMVASAAVSGSVATATLFVAQSSGEVMETEEIEKTEEEEGIEEKEEVEEEEGREEAGEVEEGEDVDEPEGGSGSYEGDDRDEEWYHEEEVREEWDEGEYRKEEFDEEEYQHEEEMMEDSAVPPPFQEGDRPFCFREDGTRTHERAECDPNQARHWEQVDESSQDVPHPESGAADDELERRFEAGGEPSGQDIIPIVAEALQRLSDMQDRFRGTPAEQDAWDMIQWLSDVLSKYAGADVPPEESERLKQEMRDRLNRLLEAQQSMGPAAGGEFGPEMPAEHLDCILDHMENMLGKLPQIVAIFEREGLPVEPDARDAVTEAQEAFQQQADACRENPETCELEPVFRIVEERMRPPMEQAIMENERMDVMNEIEELMGDKGPDCGMEEPSGDMPPPHMAPPPMNEQHGDMPPPDMTPLPHTEDMPRDFEQYEPTEADMEQCLEFASEEECRQMFEHQ